jgi:hypothetical protein
MLTAGISRQNQLGRVRQQRRKNVMKVGSSHIKGTVRQIRNSLCTFESSLCDMIDNSIDEIQPNENRNVGLYISTNEGQVNKVEVHDNRPGGIQNIYEEGIKNPFNMTHERQEHYGDNLISEFGTGMKKGFLSLSNDITIYTKTPDGICHKVHFDIVKMQNEKNPNNSFDPHWFEVSSDEYDIYHKGENEGSVIIMKDIIPKFSKIPNKDKLVEFLDKIYLKLGKKCNIMLYYDDDEPIRIGGKDNILMKNRQCRQRSRNTYVYVDENVEKIVFRILNSRGESYYKYDKSDFDENSKALTKINKQDVEFDIEREPDMMIYTTSTAGIKGLEEIQHRNMMMISRNDRIYGEADYSLLHGRRSTDGYQNHIFNYLSFKSKKLSSLIGVTQVKTINDKIRELIPYALGAYQRLMKTSTMFHKNKFVKNKQKVKNKSIKHSPVPSPELSEQSKPRPTAPPQQPSRQSQVRPTAPPQQPSRQSQVRPTAPPQQPSKQSQVRATTPPQQNNSKKPHLGNILVVEKEESTDEELTIEELKEQLKFYKNKCSQLQKELNEFKKRK